ncbi:hypothetical protein [Laedolimicola sp.]|uniref:hypothetical protein n=1 Tax=Laedolimicola sp. TaxID=2981663 RepID=UPI003F81D92E
MDDMYNNDIVNENVNQATENAYQQSASDPYQKSVQEQLQYQYREPETDLEEPISMGEWLVTMLLMLIPCVNIVLMFVWAFSSKEKKSKSNYFKAALIFAAIVLVLYIILIAIFGVAITSMISSNYAY